MRLPLVALPWIACLGLGVAVAATGLPAAVGDTGPDSGDTAPDSGDTAIWDTAEAGSPTGGAAALAGETGGCAGCAVPSGSPAGLLPVLAAFLLARRRR